MMKIYQFLFRRTSEDRQIRGIYTALPDDEAALNYRRGLITNPNTGQEEGECFYMRLEIGPLHRLFSVLNGAFSVLSPEGQEK